MINEGYTNRDLKVAEELGGLKTAVLDFTKRNDSEHQELKSILKSHDYECNRQIEKIWEKVDKNRNLIKWIMGIGTGVVSISGVVMALLKGAFK